MSQFSLELHFDVSAIFIDISGHKVIPPYHLTSENTDVGLLMWVG